MFYLCGANEEQRSLRPNERIAMPHDIHDSINLYDLLFSSLRIDILSVMIYCFQLFGFLTKSLITLMDTHQMKITNLNRWVSWIILCMV